MQVIRNKHAILLALLVFAAAPAHAQVARMLEVKGTTLVERAGQPPRILGANDLLDAQQVVTVARDSHAIIEFSDKTRVTLRPGTIFRVDDYRQGSPESYLRGLLKGGARIISNPFTAHSAEFDARLCEKDCAEEDRLRPAQFDLPMPVARVVEMKGTAAAARGGGNARMLVPGAAVYERDGVATGANSHAVLVFSDGSRITLAENSRLAILGYRFDDKRRAGTAEIHHISGVARVQSGAIAKQGPEYYRFVTPLGEVRPHGTGWDSVAGGVKKVADEGADTVRETGETVVGAVQDTAGQAAQTALNATIRPIMETMSVLMTNLRDHPPTTEAGWNDLASKMTQVSGQLHSALDGAVRAAGSVANSDAFKTMVGLALAAELEMHAVGAAIPMTIPGADPGLGFYAALITGVQAARSNTYQSESLALVGLSSSDLDRVSSNRYVAHTIIEGEVGGYLASQDNAAANDFFAKAEAAAEELRLRAIEDAQQAEAAAARAAAEAEQRAMDDAARLADEAREAELEAERLAAEAEALRQRQREKLQEGQAKLEKAAGEGADAAKKIGEAVVETGQAAANQAAQTALDAATAPIMREMTRLMSEIKNNPPTTEAGWNELMSQMTEISSRLDDAMDAVVSANVAILNSDAYKAMSGVGLAGKLHLYAVLAVERGELGDAAFVVLRMHMAAMTVADYESLAALGLSFADLMRVRESQYEAHVIIQTEIMSHLTSQGSAAAREFFAAAQAAGQAMQQRAQQAEAAAQRAAAEAARLAVEAEQRTEEEATKAVKTGQSIFDEVVEKTDTAIDKAGGATADWVGQTAGDAKDKAGKAAKTGQSIFDEVVEKTDTAVDKVGGTTADWVGQTAGDAKAGAGAQSGKALQAIEQIRAAEREFARQVSDLRNALRNATNLSEAEKQRVLGALDEWSRLVGEEVARLTAEVMKNPNAQVALTSLKIMAIVVATVATVIVVGAVIIPLAALTAVAHTVMTNPSVFEGVPASAITQATRSTDQAAEAMRAILAAMVEHGQLGAGEAQQFMATLGQTLAGQATQAADNAAQAGRDVLNAGNAGKANDNSQESYRRAAGETRLGTIMLDVLSNLGGGSGQADQPQGTGRENAASPSSADQRSPSVSVWDGSVEVAGRVVNKGESLRAASDGQMVSGSSSGAPVINAPRPDLVKVAPSLFVDGEVVSGSVSEAIAKRFDRYGHRDRNSRDESTSWLGDDAPPDGYVETYALATKQEPRNRDERNSRPKAPPDGYTETYALGTKQEPRNRDERNSRSENAPPDGYTETYGYGAPGKDRTPGLYAWVRDGVVTLNRGGRQVEVSAGNAVVVTADQVAQLDHVPNFMRFDQTPRPDDPGRVFVLPPFVMTDGSVAGNCAVK